MAFAENDGPANLQYASQLGGTDPASFSEFNPDALYLVVGCAGEPLGWAGGDVLGTNLGGPYMWDPAGFLRWGSGAIPPLMPEQGLDVGNLNLVADVDSDGDTVPECDDGFPRPIPK